MDCHPGNVFTSPIAEDDAAQLGRFGDSGVDIVNSARLLFHGSEVASRMAAIRRTIQYIRKNWSDYPTFVGILRDHLLPRAQEHLSSAEEENRRLINSILSARKEWLDRQASPFVNDNFDIVRLYTSKFGYDQIFLMLNSMLRTDNLTEHTSQLQATVFLVELLNIDLYNYLYTNPSANFQGVVYRGVSLHTDQIQGFKDLAAKPVRDRYWSVPLSMMSASISSEVALKFARFDASHRTSHSPFLWRIHVADLDPNLLKIYCDGFPTSIVTTLCAVRIHELSEFQEEEVLLRGPFFQLIRIEDEVVDGREPAIPVMDLVMLNTNRDHPSTDELGDLQDDARQMFACLVGMGRAAVCKEVAESFQLADDIEAYRGLYDEQQSNLNKLCGGSHC